MPPRIKKFETTAEYNQNYRRQVIILLGGKCVTCGFSDPRALQVDHVNGDGYGNRNGSVGGWGAKILLRAVREDLRCGTGRFQLLCANCNRIKQIVNREFGGRIRNGLNLKIVSRFETAQKANT